MFCRSRVVIGAAIIMMAVLCSAPVWAAEDATELAKKTQNPVADLISIPFQSNFNFGVGPKNVTQYVLNVQPVIPFKLTEEWNLITRTILPIINQPSPADGIQSNFGVGDLNPTLFLSPAKPGAQSYLIQTNEPSQFTIDLKTVGGEARYDLVYEYYGSADGGGGRFGMGGGDHQRQQNMAKDVCAGLAP